MYSSLISMVEKAKRYADEPERIRVRDLDVDFRGNNGTHRVTLRGDEWHCECDHFEAHGLCAHVMTLQRIFGASLRDEVRYTAERVTA
ncbi:MAG: hypothetical protein KGJ98_04090 [Chloroflexota bacterium]|nr:hypothetical protein [Chloroflexota bacterium]MDE3101396.1 hypothetical protein [Chloroflexota bacterium]